MCQYRCVMGLIDWVTTTHNLLWRSPIQVLTVLNSLNGSHREQWLVSTCSGPFTNMPILRWCAVKRPFKWTRYLRNRKAAVKQLTNLWHKYLKKLNQPDIVQVTSVFPRPAVVAWQTNAAQRFSSTEFWQSKRQHKLSRWLSRYSVLHSGLRDAGLNSQTRKVIFVSQFLGKSRTSFVCSGQHKLLRDGLYAIHKQFRFEECKDGILDLAR